MMRNFEKVCCVGWHKTGTTTVGEALLLLGYKVVGARLDLAEPLLKGDVERVLDEAETFDAFQDVPWAVLYKEMDRRFPGSKFILIERDEKKWLQSALKHFGNRHLSMHEWMYGSGNIVGNEQRYLERYLKHNEEVKRYFAGREDDLLVLSFEKGDGWEKLCQFLEKPVPSVKFPHANKGRHNLKFWEVVYCSIRDIIPAEGRRRIRRFFGADDPRNRFHNYEQNRPYKDR